MNAVNQAKASLIKAAKEFKHWRAKADALKFERGRILKLCPMKETRGKPCPTFYKGQRHKWCDSCLSTEQVNMDFRQAVNKATGWQRALYHWCDEVKG